MQVNAIYQIFVDEGSNYALALMRNLQELWFCFCSSIAFTLGFSAAWSRPICTVVEGSVLVPYNPWLKHTKLLIVIAPLWLVFFFFFCRNLLERIPQVSLEDLMRVGHKYIAPLFDPAQSSCAICCHPSKVEEIREEFNRWVWKETALPLIIIIKSHCCVYHSVIFYQTLVYNIRIKAWTTFEAFQGKVSAQPILIMHTVSC